MPIQLTSNSLVPLEAGQGWKLEMIELSHPVPYHTALREMIIVTDGILKVESVILKSGELTFLEPEKKHTLIPEGKAQCCCLSLLERFDPLPLDAKYFGPRLERQGTYWVYDLITGEMTEGKWSAALIEIQDSPRHFHLIETEQFIVVNGVLDIEMEGSTHILHAGEAVQTAPKIVHKLKSANDQPVRVLCFSFPAFDMSDKYCVE